MTLDHFGVIKMGSKASNGDDDVCAVPQTSSKTKPEPFWALSLDIRTTNRANVKPSSRKREAINGAILHQPNPYKLCFSFRVGKVELWSTCMQQRLQWCSLFDSSHSSFCFPCLLFTLFNRWPVCSCTLLFNLISSLAMFCVDPSGSGVGLGLAILWALLFTPCSFVCWYRPVYKAFRFGPPSWFGENTNTLTKKKQNL